MQRIPKTIGEEQLKTVAEPLAVARMHDTTLTLAERKAAWREVLETAINPLPKKDFDPATFDPMETDPDIELKRRPRKEPPRRLPTLGMKPKEILEGQMVGMFESKQDLYLLIAWLSERVSDLEERLDNQQPQPPTRT